MTAAIEDELGGPLGQAGGPARSTGNVNRSEDGSSSRKPRVNNRATAAVTPTDDEILGIAGEGRPRRDETGGQVGENRAEGNKTEDTGQNSGTREGPSDSPSVEAALEANPELKQAWDDVHAYRESFATPAEAQAATAALGDLARLDALFFSGQPQDHTELARVVASLDPAAFRSLARAMTEVANDGARTPAVPRVDADANHVDPRGNAASQNESQSRPEAGHRIMPAQETFFHSTNDAAVRSVVEAIEVQVDRLLPEEISKGARNRLIGEIYRELDTSLRSDGQFSRQAREAFRSGSLDADHRRVIVSLVNNRARQSLPAVAKRVLNEWTSAVVAANEDRRARQRTAERRVDITGSGRTGGDSIRPVTPRDINYTRMSDADILNL